MSITPYWYDDDKTILVHPYECSLQWDDVYQMQARAIELTRGITYPICIIADGTEASFSGLSGWVTNLYRLAQRHPDNWVLVVIVIQQSCLHSAQHLTRIFEHVFPAYRGKYRYATTLEEALAIIAAHRASHSDS